MCLVNSYGLYAVFACCLYNSYNCAHKHTFGQMTSTVSRLSLDSLLDEFASAANSYGNLGSSQRLVLSFMI